jgi:hypothetical protein
MSAHRPHPVVGQFGYDDPDDAILYDDCERCAQHAENLVSLDWDRLARLWRRMLDVERHDGAYTTQAEAAAGRELYRVAVLAGRLWPGLDPWTGRSRIPR